MTKFHIRIPSSNEFSLTIFFWKSFCILDKKFMGFSKFQVKKIRKGEFKIF